MRERRVDVIAFAIWKCYAPRYDAGMDPANDGGKHVGNLLRGDAIVVRWGELNTARAAFLEVRQPEEWIGGSIRDAINLPSGELRQRMDKLPRDHQIRVNRGAG
ncbi:MAG: hypothetical protein IT160_15185 [Bryobacterales bacterium]|nr:hypothetical protein [Bryobacterales bacterium]